MKSVLLLNVVGLTPGLIGANTPHLRSLAGRGCSAPMTGILPGVTCSAQATMLTGSMPSEHGAVGNGWFERDYAEISLWRQSNNLVRGEKLYEAARRIDPGFTCSKLFWWWNMGAAVDWSITPRPFYPADGRKIVATYSWPTAYGAEMESALGPFPFFDFWGPKAGLPSSAWIAAAAQRTLTRERPTLTMVYLPHLDYNFQRFGPHDERSLAAVREVDSLVGELLVTADESGIETVVVSEYGIAAVDKPVHINRALRESGLLVARATPTGDRLDVFGSRAFAVSDHQLAHVYVRAEGDLAETRALLEDLAGVERVLDRKQQHEFGIDHKRAGDLVVISQANAWFTYYYWLDEAGEPDFARTVDIHSKPGYDPCEMFLDPGLKLPMLRVARRLLQKKLGMRYLMDVIPLKPELVAGSHGRLPADPQDGPVFMCSSPWESCGRAPIGGRVAMTSVKRRILDLLQR